jgi:hypothetical protein
MKAAVNIEPCQTMLIVNKQSFLLLHDYSFLGLFFELEDVGDMLFRNVY